MPSADHHRSRPFRRNRRDTDRANEDHMTDVYARHSGSITAYALRRASGADAADVVADTFMVAWRRHGEIPDEPNTLPWLYGVARRVLANQRRSIRRRGALHERLRDEFVEFESGADPTVTTERFDCVAAALTRLSDDDAELLRLTAWEGLGPTEIATALDADPGAVRQRLRRARTRLRGAMEAADPIAVTAEANRDEAVPAAYAIATVASESDWSRGGGRA